MAKKNHNQIESLSPTEATKLSHEWVGTDPYHNPRDNSRDDCKQPQATYGDDGYIARVDTTQSGSHIHLQIDGSSKDFTSIIDLPENE